MADDIPYWLKRSHDEAVRSIQARHPAAAQAHEELCRRYTRQVQDELRLKLPPGG